MSPAPELKATLTLPQTAFPMKANLPQNEPLRLARWASLGLYEELRKAARGRPAYLLHDGPPYANGPIHLGHALNKGLKDFVVKSKTMAGFDAPYVPGYDCHGLPIEIKVEEQLGRKRLELPRRRSSSRPAAPTRRSTLTCKPRSLSALAALAAGTSPTRPCPATTRPALWKPFMAFSKRASSTAASSRSTGASTTAPRWPRPRSSTRCHTSPSVYVRYRLTSDPAAIDPALARKQVSTIIWTTTPWTLPASMAVAFHPDFDYVALEAEVPARRHQPNSGCPIRFGPGNRAGAPSLRRSSGARVGDHEPGPVYIVAAELAARRRRLQSRLNHRAGPLQRQHARPHHLPASRSWSAASWACWPPTSPPTRAPARSTPRPRTARTTSIPASATAWTKPAASMPSGHIQVDPGAWPLAAPPAFEGKTVWAANPIIVAMLEESGALLASTTLEHSYPHCWRCHHPVIFRATEQWFIGMETPVKRQDGSETTFRQLAIEEIDKVVWDPAWGKERITNMIATRPDWCISRQRIWGVPIAVFLCEQCNQPIVVRGAQPRRGRPVRARRH